jgi:uncharacterized membrane protein
MPASPKTSWRNILRNAEAHARELDSETRHSATIRALNALALFGVDLGLGGDRRERAREHERMPPEPKSTDDRTR